jgi:hypothetical protein
MKIIERVFNSETGETTEVERTLTKADIDAIEAKKAEVAAKQQAEAAKAAARQAILDRLGLTADEAALLLGAN